MHSCSSIMWCPVHCAGWQSASCELAMAELLLSLGGNFAAY